VVVEYRPEGREYKEDITEELGITDSNTVVNIYQRNGLNTW